MDKESLLEYALNKAYINENDIDVISEDSEIIEFLFDNCEITFPKECRFFARVNCEWIMYEVNAKRSEQLSHNEAFEKYKNAEDTLAYVGSYDFGHTAPVWEDVLKLGISGLKNRLEEYKNKNGDKNGFYSASVKVYDALIRFVLRCGKEAEKAGKSEIANGLYNISKNAPSNLFEAIQTIFVFYCAQHNMECTFLRTLGRIDSLLMPFYSGSEVENQMISDFLIEADSYKVSANMPVALGGVDKNGNSLINKLSYAVLENYKKLKPADVKLHILYSKNMPDAFLNSVFEGIRDGANSMVLLSDNVIQKGLVKLGADKEDAREYSVVGCYECGAKEEVTCSCNGFVNIAKAVEFALNNGSDILTQKKIGLDADCEFETFEDFYNEFLRQLKYILECSMEKTDICERNYMKVHFAPFFSSSYKSCVEKGEDAYCHYGSKYANSSVNAFGLATAVDSLMAIKKLVFEDKTMSASELLQVLKNNWKGNEKLRLIVKNKFPKYGNGIKEVDFVASDIVKQISDVVNGRKNVKGGVYRLGTFSINWRFDYGKKMAASADGRLACEPTSQNSGASFGADREGVTAHIMSVTEIDAVNVVNGNVLDLDIHYSAVKGEYGLLALRATAETYFERGGFAVHYNVLNPEVLKEAQANPEKYPNLQVRVCGWNSLFSDLTTEAQNEFISRAMI